jgi:DNA polymerase III subunit epsilon
MKILSWSNASIAKLKDSIGRSGNKPCNSQFAGLPIDIAKFIVLDTELTGLNSKRDRIITIGALKMQGKRIMTGETFYEMVKPNVNMSGASVVIHGITPSELAEKPAIGEVLPKFMEFAGYHILVGFYPQIDLEFINKELVQLGEEPMPNMIIDIQTLYNWLAEKNIPGYRLENKNLYDIAAGFEIPIKGAHNALGDAYITAQVFQRILHAFTDTGAQNVEDLCRVSNPTKVGDALRQSMKTSNF